MILCWRRCRSWQCPLASVLLTSLLLAGTLTVQWTRILKQPLRREVLYVSPDKLKLPDDSSLIDLDDFELLLDNDVCSQHPVYVLAFVHSAPGDVHARNAIRATWGGVHNVSGRHLRTVFLLGATSPQLQLMVQKENERHRDIVQGNFIDSYANLSYKHVMGHKWVASRCKHATFVLKTDEDVFVDVYQLVDYLLDLYGERPTRTLMCNVIPEGTLTRREGKWTVPVDEYPFREYPRYCTGLAYVVTPDVSRDLVAASAYVPFFWIDDVYVTGFLAEVLKLRHLSLNFRLTMDVEDARKWIRDNDTYPSPYMIVGIGDVQAWTRILRIMWDKTNAGVNRRDSHVDHKYGKVQ